MAPGQDSNNRCIAKAFKEAPVEITYAATALELAVTSVTFGDVMLQPTCWTYLV
jgi:hypothetical protein